MKLCPIHSISRSGEEILETGGALVIVIPKDFDSRVHSLHGKGVLGDALSMVLECISNKSFRLPNSEILSPTIIYLLLANFYAQHYFAPLSSILVADVPQGSLKTSVHNVLHLADRAVDALL